MNRPTHRASRRHKGIAMVLVVVCTAVAMVLAMGFISVQATSVNLSSNIRHAARARALAESGLAMTIRYINNTSNWRTLNTPGTWLNNQSLLSGLLNVKVVDGWDNNGDGVITGNATQFVSTDAATVTVTATYQGASYSCTAVMMPQAQGKVSYGMTGVGSITMTDWNTLIDSFDSSKGNYGAWSSNNGQWGQNCGSNAVVVTNSTASNTISVGWGCQLNGSCCCGYGGNPNSCCNFSGSVSGNRSALSCATPMASLTSPTGMGSTCGNKTYGSNWGYNQSTTVSGNVHCTNLTIQNNMTVKIQGNVTMLVDGNCDISNGGFEITAGSSLKLYCSGSCNMHDGACNSVDGTGLSRCQFFNLGSNQWTLTDNDSSMEGVIISPNANVNLCNGFQHCGAVCAKGLSMSNGGQLHEDKNITTGSDPVTLPGACAGGFSTRWVSPF